jgi:hypothetical protein
VVVNLSSKPLNAAESSLLSKGLNFCPNPPKINVRELIRLPCQLYVKSFDFQLNLTFMAHKVNIDKCFFFS